LRPDLNGLAPLMLLPSPDVCHAVPRGCARLRVHSTLSSVVFLDQWIQLHQLHTDRTPAPLQRNNTDCAITPSSAHPGLHVVSYHFIIKSRGKFSRHLLSRSGHPLKSYSRLIRVKTAHILANEQNKLVMVCFCSKFYILLTQLQARFNIYCLECSANLDPADI